MKIFLTLITQFLLLTNSAFAECMIHTQQAQMRTRSSVTVSEDTKDLKKLATISKKQAKSIAVSQYAGKVKKAELVKEDGTLIWKLEVKGKEGQKEIFIDPANGTFLGYGLTK